MPRIARIVVPGIPHHITQRGNNRQDIFLVDQDRRVYLDLLRKQSHPFGLEVIGYCLMSNHVHLVVVPQRADSLAKALGRAHFQYTGYFNHIHGRSGHLWQNRFFSCPLDERHALAALCYVERNPTRAGLASRPWDYVWSSAPAHCGGKDETGLLDLGDWGLRIGLNDWRALLIEWSEREVERPLRERTQTGRPLGGGDFLGQVETMLGRKVQSLPVGRPRRRK